MSTSHDQNFKNLIIDYPRQALAFFAPIEAASLPSDVKITYIRQELPKDRLGDRFFEMDVPLLVEWPNGQREALLFIVEEETKPGLFSIHRLAIYCLTLAEFSKTDHVVPVVIFLRGSKDIPRDLHLGSGQGSYLDFRYIACVLPEIPLHEHLDSDNLVARLNLVNMQYSPSERVHAYGHSIRGLMTLESNPSKHLKYMNFIDNYCTLDDTEKQRYRELYKAEDAQMMQWTERVKNEGRQEGLLEGRLEGRLETLADLVSMRFGPMDATTQALMHAADDETLKRWTRNVLTAQTLEEVFRIQ
jgi:UPI00004DB9FA related cluster